jgi:hypothetical protein
MSTQVQRKIFEIHIFEFKQIQGCYRTPLTRTSSPRLRSYLRFEEMRVFLPHDGLLLPRRFTLGVVAPEHLAEVSGGSLGRLLRPDNDLD